MATRSIVTSRPDIACEVCGRRLLRGEHPDVFLVGGQRRMVCELCAPRAAREGWMRDSADLALRLQAVRPPRGATLLGRLRRLAKPPEDEQLQPEQGPASDAPGQEAGRSHRPVWAGGPRAVSSEREGAVSREPHSGVPGGAPARRAPRAGDDRLLRALEFFNRGPHPRRIAGIARSLGDPTVAVLALEGSSVTGERVSIVISWELCWYRYQVELESREGAVLVAQGLELDELQDSERQSSARVDEQGHLTLRGR